MTTILQSMSALKSLNIRQMAIEAIEKNLRDMVSLNQSQLYEGKTTSGKRFRKYAKYKTADGREYADMKNQMNPRPGLGNPDLNLTGAFYRAIFAELEGDNFIMDSTDEKSGLLQSMYDGNSPGQLSADGEASNIFGLTRENWELFRDKCREDFCKEFEKRTGLIFKF